MSESMNPDAVRQQVLDALASVVPELDPATFRTHRPFRDELDVDSMDLLNFVIALSTSFGFDIPEADYRRLATVDALVDYLVKRDERPAPPHR